MVVASALSALSVHCTNNLAKKLRYGRTVAYLYSVYCIMLPLIMWKITLNCPCHLNCSRTKKSSHTPTPHSMESRPTLSLPGSPARCMGWGGERVTWRSGTTRSQALGMARYGTGVWGFSQCEGVSWIFRLHWFALSPSAQRDYFVTIFF